MNNMATTSMQSSAKPLGQRMQAALSGDVCGVPMAIVVMLLAGMLAGGVVALTTNFFEPPAQSGRPTTAPRI